MSNIILGIILPFLLILVAGYFIKIHRDDNIIKWVDIAVKAAEQMYKGNGRGKEKLGYVIKWISEKFNISESELINIIESSVYQLNLEKSEDK